MFLRRNISKQTDEELLQHYIKSGETEHFGELYSRYTPSLYDVRLKYLKDETRAQDAVMELFEGLLPKITHYEVKISRTWIYRVVRNYCL